jgi:hypothetical protein
MNPRLLGIALATVLFAAALAVTADEKPKKSDDVDALLEGGDKGVKIRLVDASDVKNRLADRLYWRTFKGEVAAQTTPATFRLGNSEVIAPIMDKASAGATKPTYTYPIEGFTKIRTGRHLLMPGNIPIDFKGGEPAADHPAIKIVDGEIQVRCVPVRLEVVNQRGLSVATPIKLLGERGTLLRDDANFRSLIVWLPVGASYSTTLGSFQLTADGKVSTRSSQLAANVTVSGTGLRKVVAGDDGAVAETAAVEPIALVANISDKNVKVPPQVPLLVPATVAPGAPLRLALSRKTYQQATNHAFTASDFTALNTDGATKTPRTLTQVKDVPSELVTQAETALKTSAGDLAWLALPVPDHVAGPITFSLRNPFTATCTLTAVVTSGPGLQLVPHRWRTAYATTEIGTYQLLLPKGTRAGLARVMVKAAASDKPMSIGQLELPDVASTTDARLFTVAMNELPPGSYQLWVEAGGSKSGTVPLVVVTWQRKSPFLVHSISGCTVCWPETDEGLQVLQNAGLEMASATGAQSQLNVKMPAIDRTLSRRLAEEGLPADLALMPTANDHLLERMLRHQLRLVDLAVVRDAAFYNEGLSYHHSYPPSVERMVRRMQQFAQQTADYASFWGVNYSWFPALYSYAEGGVPTDAHIHDRNQALAEQVKAAGFAPLSTEERRWVDQHKDSKDPANEAKLLDLMARGVKHWKAAEDLGWGRHNKIYNDAVRAVRPDAVCTLFENAGHNEGKRIRSMCNDMNAVCYESYTDFGDWPMSAGFVTDWSRGQSPRQPIWLTTCWGTSSASKMKSLFHAFARGLSGGGVPLQATFPLDELARRGTGMRFVGQYGALATHAVPDQRVALLARAANLTFVSRSMWDSHAVYCQLTRLGFPPAVLADDEVMKSGIPEYVKVLVLAREQLPLEPETRAALAKFVDRGGKILAIDCRRLAVEGAIVVNVGIKNLWDGAGFHADSHQEMWQQFDAWRKPLAEALAQTGLRARASTNPDQGYVLTMDAGPVRYVAVIADKKGTHSNVFEPTAALPVTIDGTGWTVRDLVKQTTLKSQTVDQQTLVNVDLITEPTTLLALVPTLPTAVRGQVSGAATLGADLALSTAVAGEGGRDLGAVPVRISLLGSDGKERGQWFRAAGDVVHYTLPAFDGAGAWRLTAQELLTGLTSTAELVVSPPAAPPTAVAQVGTVHEVNSEQLRYVVQHQGEKLVIVEPGQESLLPIAQALVNDLKKRKVNARLWHLKPEEFDTVPLRWYPTAEDRARLKAIEAGQLIGYRLDLTAHIDKLKRVHVPELGGYHETGPRFVVGQDCIVFSGGQLANSLRLVTSWMDTPSAPGHGQGRLVPVLSPFLANRHAIAIVAHDAEGMQKAAQQLALVFQKHAAEADKVVSNSPAAQPKWQTPELKTATAPVPQPYANFSPIQRVKRLLASAHGQAALLLDGPRDNVALVDDGSKVTATLTLEPTLAAYARLDNAGQLQWTERTVTAFHPGWKFPTEASLRISTIGTDGHLRAELPAYAGPLVVPDFEGGVVLAPDGQSALLGRPGGFLWKTKDDKQWRRFDDRELAQSRFETLCPRQPVGAAFSPDSRYVVFTMDSRPPFGGLGSPTAHPTACDTVLFDLRTGQSVWSLRAADTSLSTYAVNTGFAAVARDGVAVALIGFDGSAFLVDRSGKIVAREMVFERESTLGRTGPRDGVGVVISDSGSLAAFAFKHLLVIAKEQHVVRVPLAGVTSVCLAGDGSLVVVGLNDGRVQAFDATGQVKWTATPGGSAPLVAGTGKGVLVATGPGELVRFESDGTEVRRTAIVAVADREKHAPTKAADFSEMPAPISYVESDTLSIAKASLGAQQVAAWSPTGTGKTHLGRTFYKLEGTKQLAAERDTNDVFVHLVYRRPEGNKALRIVTEGRDGKETFHLDLPTPEYRVVDLPVRGPNARVQVVSDGPSEVAELSLWKYRWPGPNIAFVQGKSLDTVAKDSAPAKSEGLDDILDDLGQKSKATGKLKNCRIWWPNTDPDMIRGHWLTAPLEPLQMVDGKRFGNGVVKPWGDRYMNYAPTRGAFFTIDFGESTPPALVATYDRAARQSEVCTNFAMFRPDSVADTALTAGAVFARAVGNDQYWRLFPLAKPKLTILGVHVIHEPTSGYGLSEIEVYR